MPDKGMFSFMTYCPAGIQSSRWFPAIKLLVRAHRLCMRCNSICSYLVRFGDLFNFSSNKPNTSLQMVANSASTRRL
jgi:hypothetical protein